MNAFIYSNWHAWEANGKILLSDETTKTLLSFQSADSCINWLFMNDDKPAARALNAHIKDASK